jgi:hypothetical protein
MVSRSIIAIFAICMQVFASGFMQPLPSAVTKSHIVAMASSSSTEKKPPSSGFKNFGRFVKTLSFYDVLKPKLPFGRKPSGLGKTLKPNEIIWSMSQDTGVEWGPLDDVVMGGVSQSDLDIGSKFDGKWTGYLTDANNGGFVGIRTKKFDPPLDISQCRGIVLKVRGEGQKLKCICRDDDQWNGIAWTTSFDTTKNRTVSIKIPFGKLVPTKFARTVTGIAPFNSKTVYGVQLSYSKFEYDGGLNKSFREGPFEIVLEEVRTF